MKKIVSIIFTLAFLVSCGEEVLTKNTQKSAFKSTDLETFELSTCSQMTLRKPPVDILYIIDNSGSTLSDSFQSIKGEIKNTINQISNDFDYHIYFAPLNPLSGDSISGYPLLLSDPDSIPSPASVNITNPDKLNMFSQATGNNVEYGFSRALNLIKYNRSNGIFRNDAHTIVVMISNGDDNESLITIRGNKKFDPKKYAQLKTQFLELTKQYASANSAPTNPLNAQTLRFMSLVAHSDCNGWKAGETYKQMSSDIYRYQNLKDNDELLDSVDLCSQNYSVIFESVNNSIRSVIDGHKYDHWKISSAKESDIQSDDIQVSKIKKDGSKVSIPQDATNGFEYLGYVDNQKLTYEPADANEVASGLIIKLNGSARVEFPECIIAKTRTPTEYFGYFALPQEPELETLEVKIDGKVVPRSNTNGWSYIGWLENQNIKVPGPTNASITPPITKAGFFIKLNGDAVFSNGTSIQVFYKNRS